MLDYLSDLWNDYKQFKNDYIEFDTTIITEPRSDIMKELTYSRQQTDSCSLQNNLYNSQSRLFDCTRVEDELMSPISTSKINFNNEDVSGYCYGKELGKLFNKDLTDNWFCCQQYQKAPTLRSQTP